MNLMELTKEELPEVIETDVLIVGGGLAGCAAAIKAKDNKNVDVILLEKAAVRRSGEAGAGMDHYPNVAHPRVNGITAEEFGRMRTTDMAGLVSTKLSILTAKDAIKPLVLLEEIGVKLREEDGTYKMLTGRTKKVDFMFYRGADLKLKLAAEVHKRGVKVFDRTMCTNLITKDGSVVGATAVNIRNGKFLVFKAKAILLSTGGIWRLYEYPFATFPSNLFIAYQVSTNSGDGAAVAYRAGAKLTNMEYTYVHQGLAGWPSSAFVGHLGPHVPTKTSKGENLQEKYPEIRERVAGGSFHPWTNYAYMPNMSMPEAEREVLYYNTTEVSGEIETYGYYMAANEAPMGVKIIRDRGGLRRAPFEIRHWISGVPRSFSGLMFDEKGETSLKGLFVAGDTQGGLPLYGAMGALVWGCRIGRYLAEYVPNTNRPSFDKEQFIQVQAERNRIRAPLSRRDGTEALELEDFVRKVMRNYVEIHKIEPKLKRAMELAQLVKERFVPTLIARNPHELMRALEVQNIIDIAEIHAYTALLRTETRLPPYHYRVDFPEQDDLHWKKNIVVQNIGGKIKYTLETLE